LKLVPDPVWTYTRCPGLTVTLGNLKTWPALSRNVQSWRSAFTVPLLVIRRYSAFRLVFERLSMPGGLYWTLLNCMTAVAASAGNAISAAVKPVARDHGRDVVIVGQPIKAQFDRIVRLPDPRLPADSSRGVQVQSRRMLS
jgi:hypothetical protein